MIFHDSSATFINRSRPGFSAVHASCALIQAVAHAIRIPTAGESRTACRSSTSSRASRSSPGLVGPSKIPLSGPSQRSCRASAARRESAASASEVVCRRAAISADGSNMTAADLRQRRLRIATPDRAQGLAQRGRLDLLQRLADRCRRDRAQQIELGVLLGPCRKRVEPNAVARRQRDRLHPQRAAERPVFAFDVEHERPAPEQQHAPEQGLDQRALALTELADHDRVWVVEDALVVEHPRVEAEGAAAGVPPDERTAAAESATGRERVDRLCMPRGDAMGGAGGAHRSPLASGNVKLNASACWPYMHRSSSRARAACRWISAHARRSSPSSRPLTVTKPARRTSP